MRKLVFVSWVTVTACLFFAFSSCSSVDEITAYPLVCTGSIRGGKCLGKLIAGNKSVYKLLPERDEVSWSYPGLSTHPITSTDCEITNVSNWRCLNTDGSGMFGFNDGNFWSEPPQPNIIYVSKSRWWYVRLKGFFD